MKYFLALVLPVLALQLQAAVIYTQPPGAAGGVLKSSWYPPDGMDGDEYAYDDFTLSATRDITEIRWRGGYTNILSGAGKSPVFDFRISVYPSIAAGTQPDITVEPLARYTVGGTAGETPAGTVGNIPMYDYVFVLPTPFHAVAGTKYWLQIEASQGLTPVYGWPPDWGLAVGTGGNGAYFRTVKGGIHGGGTLYQVVAKDTAFALLSATAAGTYTITTSALPAEGGTTIGGGQYEQGGNVTVTATAQTGYQFVNWTENGTAVSTAASYTFSATANRTLVAHFRVLPSGDLNNDSRVDEDDVDLVLQYLLGERADLETPIKTLANQAGLPANPPDIRVALWIMKHRTRSAPGGARTQPGRTNQGR